MSFGIGLMAGGVLAAFGFTHRAALQRRWMRFEAGARHKVVETLRSIVEKH